MLRQTTHRSVLLLCLFGALLAGSWSCSSGDGASRDTGTPAVDTTGPGKDGLPDSNDGAAPGDAEADTNAALCERLGLAGECEGDVLRYCAFGELKERDCGREYAALGLEASCAFLSDAWGYDCVLAAGQLCVDQGGNIAVCEGAASGCFMGADERYTCRADIGSCDPDAAPQKKCEGQLLLEICEVAGQLFGVDCAAFGGRCEEALGACVDLPSDMACDDTKRRCADGLTCQAGVCTQ